MRSGKGEMGHTADIAGMLVGITGTMAGFSFRMHMRRSAGFHVRTDTECFVVMMMWKNAYHQHPQTDKQQAICIYTMFHSLSLTGAKVKRNTEKNNILYADWNLHRFRANVSEKLFKEAAVHPYYKIDYLCKQKER